MNLIKRMAVGLSVTAGMLAAPAWASDRVIGLLKGVSSLSVYAKPYDAQAQTRIKAVSFPLAVLDKDGDFLKVNLAGKEVWIDGAEVAIDKAVTYTCVASTKKPAATAAVQGASTGCQ
jgi:hypothetical protein